LKFFPAFFACACATLLSLAANAQSPDSDAFQIDLKPVAAEGGSEVESLEVRLHLPAPDMSAGEPILELAYVTYNAPSAAGRIEHIEAKDAQGVLPLSAADVGAENEQRRQWSAPRETVGDLVVSYRVPVNAPLAPRGAAPPVELRNDAGAVSASGAGFLLRPPGGNWIFRVSWDLSALPAGSTAVSSLEYGTDVPLPVATLDRVYFMAGDLGRYPESPGETGFFSAWQGEPPFDARALMVKAETLREDFIAFFDSERGGYGIMMRPNPVNPGGGIGLHDSFVVTFDDATEIEDLEFTLAHEMFHTYQPQLDDDDDANSSLEQAWFNEGLAVFYQREFLFRAGLIDAEAYVSDLNTHAARYYTSKLVDTPNSAVAEGFWRDTRIRTLPYDRGFLYFATVDEAVRAASNNARSLDDLVKELRRKQDEGIGLTPAHWEAVLRDELGAPGVEAFHEMLEGAAPLPSSGAFGACFRRTTRDLRRYELGFEPAVLVEQRRIVRDLAPDSAAEAAGLQNGDEILKPVPQDAVQGDQDAYLELQVRRGEKQFPIRYRPRGETVSAWQWERVPGADEQSCRIARSAGDT
jgi:hypothetical protein